MKNSLAHVRQHVWNYSGRKEQLSFHEIIYKEYVTLKIEERSSLGFDEVHHELNLHHFARNANKLLKLQLMENAASAGEVIGATCVLKMERNNFSATLCSI